MASLVFAVEPLRGIWDELLKLSAIQWQETKAHENPQPFRPSLERYESYEKIGCYVQFTARHDGQIVGYCGLYIVPSMHTQETLATEDAWFLLPEYRKGWNAIRFFKFMEAECVKRGAKEIALTTPYQLNSGRICEFLKYKPIATVYSKQILTP